MRSRMRPHYYLSQDIFDREQEKIFRKIWLFAGLKTLLAKNNAFITRRIAGIPVVIQNFNGTLRAFENVCLHRSALIQSAPAGCRPLVCPYHAWSYTENGEVRNIPDCRSLYLISKAERQKLKLREFALHAVGNVLFINMDSDPFPIGEQFAPEFIDLLESSSSSYDSEVMTTTWHGKFNWKLAYENLRDGNHPRFVHARTLAREVDFIPGVDVELAAETLRDLGAMDAASLRREMRRFSFGGVDGKRSDMRRFPFWDRIERWPGESDAYYNWLAFPNLHVASPNGGRSFTVEHHIPVAPDRTDIEIFWFTSRKKQPYATSSQVLLESMHGSKLVVGEDVDVMERVQAALHAGAPMPNQGVYEFMNRLVERWYALMMETDHAI